MNNTERLIERLRDWANAITDPLFVEADKQSVQRVLREAADAIAELRLALDRVPDDEREMFDRME